MKKLNEMQIGKRLTTAFRFTTMITSIAAIAAIIVLYIISNRYTYALRYFGFPQGDVGQAIIQFTDTRSDLRAIIGYYTQSEILVENRGEYTDHCCSKKHLSIHQ